MVQIVKVIDKAEWPKMYVHVETGQRTRFFSKSDVPDSGYLLEDDYEKVRLEATHEEAQAKARETLKAKLKAEKAA